MKSPKIKNYMILCLVVLSVLQTARLWLDEDTGREISMAVAGMFDGGYTQKEAAQEPMAPGQMVLGFGDRQYAVLPMGAESQPLLAQAFTLLDEAVFSATYLSTDTVDWSVLLERPCVLLQYPFDVTISEFVKGFQGKGNAMNNHVKSFHTVAVFPASTGSEESLVAFINKTTGEAVTFVLSQSQMASTLYSSASHFTPSNQLWYLSTAQSGLNLFDEGYFVPQWQTEVFTYPILRKVNPFVASAGTILTAPLEGFFANYGAVSRELTDNGGFVLSDTDTVVKYYPTGVLEYYNYQSEKKENQTVASAYTACMNFLRQKDVSLDTDYYLADVALKSDGLTFYFDFSCGGLPLSFEKGMMDELGLSHAMEVVVSNNTVRKYKRLAYYFTLSETETGQVDKDFLSALEEGTARHSAEGSVTRVDALRLVYRVGYAQNSPLNWQVTIDGTTYNLSGEKE